jgi:hypothetical protein
MEAPQIEELVEVECFASTRYPERPQRVTWRGTQHEVLDVEHEWKEPRRRCYLVLLEGDLRLRLCYYERTQRWSAVEAGGK